MFNIRTRYDAENGRYYTYTPYNREFIRRAKQAGGKWDGESWSFSHLDHDRADEIIKEVYGWEPDSPMVTIRVKASELEEGNSVMVAGEPVATRRSRDEEVTLAPDVVLVEGTFKPSGGSTRYPSVDASDDVVLEIRGIPECRLKKLTSFYENPVPYTLVEDRDTVKEDLLRRKTALLKELQDVEDALSKYNLNEGVEL